MPLPYNTVACFIEKPGIIHSLKEKDLEEEEEKENKRKE